MMQQEPVDTILIVRYDPGMARKLLETAKRVIYPPKWVRARNGKIYYRPNWKPEESAGRRVPDDLIQQFAALASATDDEITAFATKYGALGVCSIHGLPHFHRGAGLVTLGDVMTYGIAPIGDCEDEIFHEDEEGKHFAVERISDWRGWAHRFALMIQQRDALRDTTTGPRHVIKFAMPYMLGLTRDAQPPVMTKYWKGAPRKHLPDIERVINSWLKMAGVHAQLLFEDGRPLINLGGSPSYLLPALTEQLLKYIIGRGISSRPIVCDGCGEPMPDRKRRPKRGVFAWCRKAECRALSKRLSAQGVKPAIN